MFAGAGEFMGAGEAGFRGAFGASRRLEPEDLEAEDMREVASYG
jgi:hypothetical protein